MNGLKYAINGIKTTLASEVNFKTQLVAAGLVISAGWFFELSLIEWILITISIGMVLSMELINTAIEYLVDLVSPGVHPQAGKVKDISAGAVLISAMAALVTGLLIFIPKIAAFAGFDF